MAKKATRYYSKWRIDQDYVRRLSPEERAWLDRFNDEYYRASFDSDEALHPPGDFRRDVYRAQNAAARDLVTASSSEVAKAMTPVAGTLKSRFYVPADYRMLARPSPKGSLEEDLTDVLDEARPKEGDERDIVEILEGLQRPKRRAS